MTFMINNLKLITHHLKNKNFCILTITKTYTKQFIILNLKYINILKPYCMSNKL